MVDIVRDFTRRYVNLWQLALLAAVLAAFMSVLRQPRQNPAGGVTVTTTVNLRVRTGPGIDYAQLGVVPAGTTLPALGRNEGTSWVLVEHGGVRGWMAAWFCTFAGDPASVPVSGETGTAFAASSPDVSGLVVTTSANLRIRSGPGTGYAPIGEVWGDTTLPVLDRSADGNWYAVEFDGVRGWIAAWLCRVDGGQVSAVADAPMSPAPQQTVYEPQSSLPKPAAHAPTLADYWNGSARWRLDVSDTGLPVGESDTVDMGGGVFWSYLHASTQSAGIHDSCGGDVEFPGCVTRWVSTDGGRHFALSAPTCLLACTSCPCTGDDLTRQQQYPRVVRSAGGSWTMVFENGASTWLSASSDGLIWSPPRLVPGTGVWTPGGAPCPPYMQIGPNPYFTSPYSCMAGGPPGLYIDGLWTYIFVGLGESPGHMGCLRAPLSTMFFSECGSNPIFSGAPDYGPSDAWGGGANPYFDFRYVTSADVVHVDGYYYMTYEGDRGPSSGTVGRDDQYALGLARSATLDGPWEKYPGNPMLNDVGDYWGIGHADLVIVDGVTYMYTETSTLTRGRYMLVPK